MTEATTEETFDFGFDKFRAMGFTFQGVVEECRIQQPREATFTFVDKKSGEKVTRPAKPQLVLVVRPLDHQTKSGNPYKDFFALTQNTRSKLGVFVEHLKNLGIDLGTNPSILEGKEFEFEMKEVAFGQGEPTRVLVPIAHLDALNAKTADAPVAEKQADTDFLDLAAVVLDGATKATALSKLVGSTLASNPKAVAGVADGSLIQRLTSSGRMTVDENGTYVKA